jgi:hypothetical protein
LVDKGQRNRATSYSSILIPDKYSVNGSRLHKSNLKLYLYNPLKRKTNRQGLCKKY